MNQFCINHPTRKALSFCHNCGEYYCPDCLSEGMNYYYCKKVACQIEFEKEKPPDKETIKKLEEKMSKTSKAVYLIIIIIIVSLAGTVGKEAAKKLFSPSKKVNVDNSDWKIKNIFYSGLTIETPFELKESILELPTEYRNMIKEMLSYQYSSNPFSMNVAYVVYPDEIIPDLDGAVQGAINNMRAAKGVESFSSSVSNIIMDGLPGRMINGKYSIQNNQAEFIGVVYTVNSKSWQILCTFISNNENRSVAQRIINSVQIKDYKELSNLLRDNIFLKTDIENKKLKPNEIFTVKFILHTRLNIDSKISIINLPTFNGLIVDEINTDTNLLFNTVVYNGKQYRATITKQFSLIAKEKGKYLITPFELEVPVLINRDDKSVYNFRIKSDSTFITVL